LFDQEAAERVWCLLDRRSELRLLLKQELEGKLMQTSEPGTSFRILNWR